MPIINNTTQKSNPLQGFFSPNAKLPDYNNPFSTAPLIQPGSLNVANSTSSISKGAINNNVPLPPPKTSTQQVSPTLSGTVQPSYIPPSPAVSYSPVSGDIKTNEPVKGVLSFPGMINNLTEASGPTSTQTGLIKNLQDTAMQNRIIAQQARDISDQYGKKIAEAGILGAGARAGDLSTGTNVVGSGNAAIASQSASARASALAAAQDAALKGTAQQLTAQQQQASGQEAALSGANTQQAQQITGLGTAAQLGQPSPTAFGQTVFNPTAGSFSGTSGYPPEVMQQYAQMAASGQYAAIPAAITSNPVLNAQLNVAAKSINPNFNPIAATGASNVLQGIPALQSANTAAEGIKNTINNYLSSNPQLNPSDLAATNILQQWIQGKQLTDPKYQILFNLLNEYTNTLAPILGVGGDPTNLKTEIAQSFINAAASGQSISQVLNAMSSLATNKINDMQSGAVGGQTSVPNSSGTTGGFSETW